jgi:hypothetical protein
MTLPNEPDPNAPLSPFFKKHAMIIRILFIGLETAFLASSLAWLSANGWNGRPPLFFDPPSDPYRFWLMVIHGTSYWLLLLTSPLFYGVTRRMANFALLTWLAGLMWAFFVL